MKKVLILFYVLLCIGCSSKEKNVGESKIVETSYSKDKYAIISLKKNGLRLGQGINKRFIIINDKENKELLLDEKYESITFYGNYFLVKQGSKFGLIDSELKEILPCEYDNITLISNNIFEVSKNNKKALIKDGEFLTDLEYDRFGELSNEVVLTLKDGEIGAINTITGEKIIEANYNYLSNFINGYAIAQSKIQKLSYIDKLGTIYFYGEYDQLFPVIEDKGIVVKNQKYGIVDLKKSIELIECQYDYLKHFQGNKYIAKKDDKIFLINDSNEKITENEYEYIGSLVGGLGVVRKSGKNGYINENGKEIIPIMYEEVGNFENNLAIVFDLKNQKYGVINKNNEYIIKPEWDYISGRSKDLFVVGNEEGNEFLYTSKGEKALNKSFKNLKIFNNNFIIGTLEDKISLIVYLEDKIKEYDLTNKEIVNIQENEIIIANTKEYISIRINK